MCALKPEAQAFVDKYRLPKTKQNTQIAVIISGVGTDNMFNTTKDIVKKMQENDIIINVGICGANNKFKIGELLEVYIPSLNVGTRGSLTCVDAEISTRDDYELVDMESEGFLEATKKIKNRYIFKVVSDHFEPHKVTKEGTKSLIFNVIDDINEIIFNKAKH